VSVRVLPNLSSIAVAALLCGGARAATAAGEPGDRLFGGASSCPAPPAVRAEVETLVPRDRLDARLRAIGGASPPVEVIDLGVPFRVVAAGNLREYRDEGRDCAHRARIAAVFVVLVIDPAAILDAPAATATPAPPAPPRPVTATPQAAVVAAPPPAPPPPERTRARLGLGAAVEAGIGSDARVGQLGLALRLGVGGGRLALSLGAAALAPVDTTIGGVRLHHRRLPADVSVRAQGAIAVGERHLEPFAEIGAGVALMQESALDLASRQTRTAVELGVRGAAGIYLAGPSRVTPFLALHVELVPAPPTISALPRGVVGHTPSLWVGASAGAAWGWP
jgi:hypothetical protein